MKKIIDKFVLAVQACNLQEGLAMTLVGML